MSTIASNLRADYCELEGLPDGTPKAGSRVSKRVAGSANSARSDPYFPDLARGEAAPGAPRKLRPLVAIAGPTASGKSDLAIFLAERLNGEVVNYDSVQLYRGADVGSGKVSSEERQRVPHHLLDVLDPDQAASAGFYRRQAIPVLADLRRRGKLAILVGGTGLYLRAVIDGLFDGPARSPELRMRLRRIAERFGGAALHRTLRRFDPSAAARIHAHDTQKLIRAAEVCLLTGKPISALHKLEREPLQGYAVIKLAIDPPREALAARINQRVEWMFANGLLSETQSLIESGGDARRLGPLGALGYRQACAVLKGDLDEAEAIRSAQTATRHYAKRQMTWFRHESDVTWLKGFGDEPDVKRQAATIITTAVRRCAELAAPESAREEKVSLHEHPCQR